MSNATTQQRPVYHVYRPVFHQLPKDREGRVFFEVQMVRAQQLVAASASEALIEAKALGHKAPVVGLALPQTTH